MRAAYQATRQEAKAIKVTLTSIRHSSRRRLNWLRDHHFKADDQSMTIDLACLRLTGSLEPWKEQE
ncbi:MAG: hypothetical protein LC791_12545 [Acidobacteria bacterium]|nr:hypothetical protein [Acidobacteriota bacterium]